MAEERQEESCKTLREKREALRQRRIRTSDIASLAQIERELYEVEEQLVSKKIAERLPVSLAAKSATLAALERVEKARKELDEASRELLTALNLQGSSTDVNRIRDRTEARTERDRKKKRSSDRLNILLFFFRKQCIQLKPIRAMISELSDRIWGRLGLSAVRAVPLEALLAPRPL